MPATRGRRASSIAKVMSVMPQGSKIRSAITSPSRLPVMPSTTWPAQSTLVPYSHLVPGSNSSGVISAFRVAVITLGWPFSSASRL